MVFEVDGWEISEDGSKAKLWGMGARPWSLASMEMVVLALLLSVGTYHRKSALEGDVVFGRGKDGAIVLLVDVKFGVGTVGLSYSGFVLEAVCRPLAA